MNPTYNVFIQLFKDLHKEHVGHEYMVQWGKDNAIIKALQKTYGPKKMTLMIEQFFKELKTDPFLQKTGATIGVLKSQVPKLLMKIGNDKHESGRGIL